MFTKVQRAILVAVVIVLMAVAASQPMVAASPIDAVVGTYAVQGTNPDRTAYALEVRISATPDNKAWLEYFVQGELAAVGIGVRTDNVLSVIFQTAQGGIGLASYKVEKNKLTGVWTLPGAPGTGTEKFSRIPALTPPVSHPSSRVEPRERVRRPVATQKSLDL